MSDEISEQPQPKKRRGRPPKVAKRHDPDESPIDGNPGIDRIFDKEPGFDYMLASDEDIPEMLYRGAVVCQREGEKARPFYDQRQNAGEADIKVKNLTLMKIETERNDKIKNRGLAQAKQRMKALNVSATQRVGSGLSSINTNFADGGFQRQVT